MISNALTALGTNQRNINTSNNASLTNRAVNSSAIASDREWAEQQAQKQMDYQERLSNTSYQRAIADMRKAGLNPALAYHQGGATTAQGAQASTSSTALQKEQSERNQWFGFANNLIKSISGMFKSVTTSKK